MGYTQVDRIECKYCVYEKKENKIERSDFYDDFSDRDSFMVFLVVIIFIWCSLLSSIFAVLLSHVILNEWL